MKPPWSLWALSLVVRLTVAPPCLNKGNLLLLRLSFLFCLARTMPYNLEYEVSQGGVVRENTLPVCPPNVTQISIFDCPHRWYRRPMIGPSIETKTGGNVRLPGLTGRDLSFGFPWIGKISHPHQAAWSQPINRCPKGNKGNRRESWKARERLSLNKSPRKCVPIKLLCKYVTNPLKPATNCLCSPYKFMYQLGLGAFLTLHHCVGCGRSPDLSQ